MFPTFWETHCQNIAWTNILLSYSDPISYKYYQYKIFCLFLILFFRLVIAMRVESFVRLPALIRLGLTGSLTMIVLRTAGHVKNYQSYNDNYAPTLHAGLLTASNGHFSSEPLHIYLVLTFNIISLLKTSHKMQTTIA